ncbi:phosphatidylglycerophosphate synthase [Paenibacillus sp. V4I9]|nr:phosphatidylglycerophosphate synthase [Paenibacillus sp. V4I9]
MNLANRITVARILLVPIIMFFLLIKVKFPHIRIEEFSITYNQNYCCFNFHYCSEYRQFRWLHCQKT